MRRLILWATIAILQAGCASVQDWHFDCVNSYRSHIAWHAADYDRRAIPCYHDFGCGWRHGFYDASHGRCGQTPPVPPKEYWSACYQSAAGAKAIGAWYQGYQEGVIAADQQGFGARARIQGFGAGAESAPPLEMPTEEVMPLPPPEIVPGPEEVKAIPSLQSGTDASGLNRDLPRTNDFSTTRPAAPRLSTGSSAPSGQSFGATANSPGAPRFASGPPVRQAVAVAQRQLTAPDESFERLPPVTGHDGNLLR